MRRYGATMKATRRATVTKTGTKRVAPPSAQTPSEHPANAMRSQTFETAVYSVLRRLRRGDVVTYGDVAMEAGFPGAARAVGRLLATGTQDVPWWRVVTSSGRLVPGHEVEHARRLRAEGVELIDGTPPRVRGASLHAHAAAMRSRRQRR